MNIIFVGKSHGKSKTFKLSGVFLGGLAVVGVVLLSSLFFLGYQLNQSFNSDAPSLVLSEEVIEQWRADLEGQGAEVNHLQQQAKTRLDALTLTMGKMQARLLRLDALGQRLTEVAKLKNGEFNFSSEPALGGPIEGDSGASYTEPELAVSLQRIGKQIVNRSQQLEVIESLFARRNIQSELFIAGRPITWGWMSSPYGYRTDPFSGKRAWHGGVDFAGKEGSDIIVAASGVVTWSGERYGYGNLIEVSHGGGFSTRYAHCKELMVEVGAIVAKGQVVAKMGSTGRSTGPHVHYEVLKNGRTYDPKKYILRASR